MKKSRKRAILWCAAVLVFVGILTGCGTSYRDDARIGTYRDDESGAYTLVLQENGKGTVTHLSSTGLRTEEALVFEIDGDTLFVLGTKESGGVIGRSEYIGTFTQDENGGWHVLLQNRDTYMPLGTFSKTK